MIEASLVANTEVQIDISTPNGSGNPFHQKAISGTIPKFTFHWTNDPRKNKEWRDKKIKEVGEIIFAQEYDIDYDASLPNIVIPNKYLRECVNIDVDTSGMIIAGLDVADDGEDKNAIDDENKKIREQIEIVNYNAEQQKKVAKDKEEMEQ